MSIVDQIFDAAAKFSADMMQQNAVLEKQRQIANVERKECGTCDHWMKSSCKPEKADGQFKSKSSRACRDFELCAFSQTMADEWRVELAELRIAAEQAGKGE